MSRTFIIVGSKAVTEPFSLNDLAGAAGRMDLLCRSLSAAFFLSHDMRRDVKAYLYLMGPPSPPRAISFRGSELKYMSPDERNIAGLIRKALGQEAIAHDWHGSTPGVDICSKGFDELVEEVTATSDPGRPTLFQLVEDGAPIDEVELGDDPVFVLGDHVGFPPPIEPWLKGWKKVSIGKRSYHTDHCITVVNHTLDRR